MEMSEKISEVVSIERAHLGTTKQVMLSTLFSEEVVSAGRRLKVSRFQRSQTEAVQHRKLIPVDLRNLLSIC